MADSQALATAKRLLARDPVAALAAARAAHAAGATPETMLVLATAARRAGEPATAVTLLRALTAAAPRAWGVHFELGLALATAGDTRAALPPLERAVAINPAATRPRHVLRDVRMIADVPDDHPVAEIGDAGLRSSVAAFLDGQDGARAALMRDHALDAGDVSAACLIAEVGMAGGRGAAVVDLLTDALALAPLYAPARFRLAEALHRLERDAEALTAIAPLFAGSPPVVAVALRGAILMRLGREEEAGADLATVTRRRPDDPFAWLAQGHGLRVLGQRDAAIHAYRRALALRPDLGEAWWSIADLKTGALGPADIAAMEGIADDEALPPPARSQVAFALGRANEDAGNFAVAFARYGAANRIRRTLAPYDAAAHDDFVRRSIAAMDRDLFDARRGAGFADAAPIFVLGMPRSGSTLVEQILASHSRVEGLSELAEITAIARGIGDYPQGLADLTPDELATLGRGYVDRVRARQRSEAPHIVDKFPGNAFHIGLIHLILPEARIIDVRRDARDCCVSIFAQNFAGGQDYSYDLFDLGRYYAGYVALMTQVDRVLPGRVLRVEYEALVDDLEGETRRLLDHCGLSFEPATLRFFERQGAVRTASSEQVRQPIYRGSIGRWRRFAPWLDALNAGLASGPAPLITPR